MFSSRSKIPQTAISHLLSTFTLRSQSISLIHSWSQFIIQFMRCCLFHIFAIFSNLQKHEIAFLEDCSEITLDQIYSKALENCHLQKHEIAFLEDHSEITLDQNYSKVLENCHFFMFLLCLVMEASQWSSWTASQINLERFHLQIILIEFD